MGSKAEMSLGSMQNGAEVGPQLRRSPRRLSVGRRHGSDSELDSTVSTTAGDMSSLDDTCEATDVSLCLGSSNSSSSFSPFKPKLMRCTSTPANLMHVIGQGPSGLGIGRRPPRSRPPVMPKLFTQPEIDGSSIASSSSTAGESCCTDTSDSGFGSTDVSVSPRAVVRARLSSGESGAIPKRSNNMVVTRSRTSSCGLNSTTEEGSLFLSPLVPPPPPQDTLLKRKGRRKAQTTRDISRRWGTPHATSDQSEQETSNHRFTVDSPGLFINRDHLDFVRRLSDKNMSHILDKIWSYLPVSDLGRALQVSTLWNSQMKGSVNTSSRLSDARAIWSENAEGGCNATNKGRPQRKVRLLKTSPRKALGNVSNLLAEESRVFSPSDSNTTSQLTTLKRHQVSSTSNNQDLLPPSILTSPSKFRHRLFADEASRLKPEEQLRPCPRCTHPSRVNPIENRAHCTRMSCQFDFCNKCMCEYHGESRCRTTIKVSSATFKTGRKNLDFSEAASESTFEASDLINVTGATPDQSTTEAKLRSKAAPDVVNASHNSSAITRSSRRKLSSTVASEKSKSRLKRL